MTLNLLIPQPSMHTDFTPKITVIGVGGGGTNAVDNMILLNLQGVEFVVANTDAQQLMHSRADRRIQLGPHITQGLGAGAKPEIGRAAAEEAADELYRHLDGVHMVFITAGMGGGTGTGAAPVIARMARERNVLTVGVVTKPFAFEGTRRARAADHGIEELQSYVDTLIVIPNQNLFRMANEKTTWKDAFKMADHVLYMGVRGVTDLMMAPGLVNLDFADIRTVMAEMGKAMMGTGEADGENRAVRAAEAAISNPLLEDTNMAGARGLLINITGGEDMTLFEVDQAANRIREEVDEEANIIFGSAIDDSLTGKVRVSVVATGIDTPAADASRPRLVAVGGGAPVPVQNPTPGIAPGSVPMMSHAGMSPGMSGGATMAPTMTATAHALSPGYVFQPAPSHGAMPVPLRAVEPVSLLSTEDLAPIDLAAYSPAGAPPATPSFAPAAPPQAAHGPVTAGPRPGRMSSSLFAEPAAVAAQQHRPPPAAAPTAPAPVYTEMPRRSIFQSVTGRLRNSLTPATPAHGDPGTAAHEPALTEHRAEAARASVRQAVGEEVGLDIPAFLRRQSS
jgi:cell division protein FtsZ